MRIETIYKDDKKVVKAVFLHNEFIYTRTYILDAEGFVEKQITVFQDGTVDIQ